MKEKQRYVELRFFLWCFILSVNSQSTGGFSGSKWREKRKSNPTNPTPGLVVAFLSPPCSAEDVALVH